MLVFTALASWSLAGAMAAGGETESRLHRGPEAAARSYALNYRDLVLANCLARAYADDADAAKDAGSSATALLEWTSYAMDAASRPMLELIRRYLDRWHVLPSRPGMPSDGHPDLMRCLDLYHGAELQDQVRRYVISPERTAREEAQAEGLSP